MEFIKIKTITELWEEYKNNDDIRRLIAHKQDFRVPTSTKYGEEFLWFVRGMYGQLGKILAVDAWDDYYEKVTAVGYTWDEHWYFKIPEVNLDIKEIEKLI